jgi:hypothetical protein
MDEDADKLCPSGPLGPVPKETTMNESHFFRNTLLVIGGVIVAGWLAVWLIHWVFSVLLYIIVGAVVIGGGIYLYGRAKRSLQSGRMTRQIRR